MVYTASFPSVPERTALSDLPVPENTEPLQGAAWMLEMFAEEYPKVGPIITESSGATWLIDRQYPVGKRNAAGGLIVMQDRFLDIQERNAGVLGLQWSAGQAIEMIRLFNNVRSQTDRIESGIYTSAYNHLTQSEKSTIAVAIAVSQEHEPDNAFFIPWILYHRRNLPPLFCLEGNHANPDFWKTTFHFTDRQIQSIPRYCKITSNGFMFAEEIASGYSQKDPVFPDQDFFLYAHRTAALLGTSVEDIVIRSAKHEATHGYTHAVLRYLEVGNPQVLAEGFTNALADIGRDQLPTTISLQRLLENPVNDTLMPEEKRQGLLYHKANSAYIFAVENVALPKLFKACFSCVSKKERYSQRNPYAKEEAWAEIACALMKSGIAMRPHIQTRFFRELFSITDPSLRATERQRILDESTGTLLINTIEALHISFPDIETAYNNLNT